MNVRKKTVIDNFILLTNQKESFWFEDKEFLEGHNDLIIFSLSHTLVDIFYSHTAKQFLFLSLLPSLFYTILAHTHSIPFLSLSLRGYITIYHNMYEPSILDYLAINSFFLYCSLPIYPYFVIYVLPFFLLIISL